MKATKYVSLLFMALVLFVNCSGNYGKIRTQTGTEGEMTLAELRENWEEYTIHYSFRSDSRPSAIMFDPKNNDKKLVGDNWYKIEDEKALSETISKIQQQYDHCHVDIIEGPDNQVYGYMYYPHWLNLPVKVVDERTLYVSTLPPYRSAP